MPKKRKNVAGCIDMPRKMKSRAEITDITFTRDLEERMGKNFDDKLEAMARGRAALRIVEEQARAQRFADSLDAKYGPDISEPDGQPTGEEGLSDTPVERSEADMMAEILDQAIDRLERELAKLKLERNRLKRHLPLPK